MISTIFIIFFCFIIILLMREVVAWYTKTNTLIKNQEELIELLYMLVNKETNAKN